MELPVSVTTTILPVDTSVIARAASLTKVNDLLDEITFNLDEDVPDIRSLRLAAEQLKNGTIPVAFGTETVYGLGADATRSEAALGIYRAKQRPSDNPLIVHIASLKQLRDLLHPDSDTTPSNTNDCNAHEDPIPDIYKPLIQKFWPGPLTIILPNPTNSRLAPEVTAGLTTFGARMPRHLIALALIQLANVPVAAPSANASTKPSPTAAEHVAYDLDGRIETILDSGPCDVGVESTVVDGLCNPPLILRPGGISIEQLRRCPGWENVGIGYKNSAETESKPKAPGMKYRHYSPNATVVLYEAGMGAPSLNSLREFKGRSGRVGIVRTKSWAMEWNQADCPVLTTNMKAAGQDKTLESAVPADRFNILLQTLQSQQRSLRKSSAHVFGQDNNQVELLDIDLGPHTADIARGIFGALRELDRQNVDAIFVEGIDDQEGDTAAAVMNRLRKAAEIRVAE